MRKNALPRASLARTAPTPRSPGPSSSTPAKPPSATASAGWKPRAPNDPTAPRRPVTVYRVEGPENQRVSFDHGKPHVSKSFSSATNQSKPSSYHSPMDYQDRAFLNFGDRPRAEEFLAIRHEQGHTSTVMKAFEVPAETFDKVRKSAVPESAARVPGNEHRPIAVDVNKGENQYGLNWTSLQAVNATALPGSGRVERRTPDMIMHPDVSAAFQELFKPK